jgi:hypothetical protein
MNSELRKFLATNFYAALIIAAIGAILFSTLLSEYYQPLMPLLLLTSLLINLLTYRVIIGKKNQKLNIMLAVAKSFALKFFSYIAIIVILLVIKSLRPQILSLIVAVFFLYLVFTFIEVKAFSAYVKNSAG